MNRKVNPSYIIAALCFIAVAALALSIVVPRLQRQAQVADRLKYGTPDIADNFDAEAATQALEYINNGRITAGMEPLQVDTGALEKAARTRAKELTELFAHERPKGQSWQSVFDQFHVPGRLRGENLASGQPTAAAVYSSWWNSASHKENMMNPDYTYTSIVCLEYNNAYYWVQLFR